MEICLSSNNDVVDGNEDELDEETNETHNKESQSSSLGDLKKLVLIGL